MVSSFCLTVNLIVQARCAVVAVEEKEVVVVVAVEVEKEAVVARGTSTGSLATTELESRLRTSVEAVAR